MEYIKGLQHIGIPTDDSEKTVAFYKSLGFRIAFETVNGKEKVVFLSKGGCIIETYENHQARMQKGAIDHIALDVSSIDEAWHDVVERLGYPSIEGKIQFLPFWDNGVKFFTIEGPNAEKIEFSQML